MGLLLAPFKPILIRVFIAFILPNIQRWANRYMSDPEFKAESDRLFGDLAKADKTEELREIARRMNELQKK